MKITPIDAVYLADKACAHEYLASVLNFPSHYGKNLDALADCLSEFDRGRAVIVMNVDRATDYAKSIIEVMDEILAPTGRLFTVK